MRDLGWQTIVVWECETDENSLAELVGLVRAVSVTTAPPARLCGQRPSTSGFVTRTGLPSMKANAFSIDCG